MRLSYLLKLEIFPWEKFSRDAEIGRAHGRKWRSWGYCLNYCDTIYFPKKPRNIFNRSNQMPWCVLHNKLVISIIRSKTDHLPDLDWCGWVVHFLRNKTIRQKFKCLINDNAIAFAYWFPDYWAAYLDPRCCSLKKGGFFKICLCRDHHLSRSTTCSGLSYNWSSMQSLYLVKSLMTGESLTRREEDKYSTGLLVTSLDSLNFIHFLWRSHGGETKSLAPGQWLRYDWYKLVGRVAGGAISLISFQISKSDQGKALSPVSMLPRCLLPC